jgi:hypothetical protein
MFMESLSSLSFYFLPIFESKVWESLDFDDDCTNNNVINNK